MSISNFITRLRSYQQRHGLRATARRTGLALRRALFANRMVVFYFDLASQNLREVAVPSPFRVDRLRSESELSRQDLEAMLNVWNPILAQRNIKERFAKGASLWLIKSDEQLAGYGWTLRGNAIAPYHFPIAPDDVQLFDFYVLPSFRGGTLFWILMNTILRGLKAEGATRAYGEAAEWNQASLASFKLTRFRRLGVARSVTIFGHRFTTWAESKNTEQVRQRKESRSGAPAMARSHER
jgi:GNAT superfamily N-acetyltransferase